MLLHVPDDLVDSVEHRDVMALWRDALGEARVGQRGDHLFRGRDRLLEKREDLRAGHAAIGGELLIAPAHVGSASDSVHDPLPHVAAQVEDEIADGVLVVRVPLPYLLIIQLSEAGFDAPRHVVELADRVIEKERCYLRIHGRSLFVLTAFGKASYGASNSRSNWIAE
jgi:hypothetical protein